MIGTCTAKGSCAIVPKADASPCDDGNACTTADACAAGLCLGQGQLACDDENPCTADKCNPYAGCLFLPAAASSACDDGDACTLNDACVNGQCAGAKKGCDDGNPCTDDSCDPKTGCAAVANTAACSDGNACSEGDQCSQGKCAQGQAKVCDDGNACTEDSCGSANGICAFVDTSAKKCDDGNGCTEDTCHIKLGCGHLNLTDACTDGNPCTTKDACANGKCTGGPPLQCDDGEVCSDDSCDPKQGCVVVANSAPCDDGVACTKGDACKLGKCVGTVDCDDKNPCTGDACDYKSGKCASTKLSIGTCDDGDKCTVGEACKDGQCAPAKLVVCDDGNVCTDDFCDAASGCGVKPNTASCDLTGCTVGDVCKDKSCVASKVERLWTKTYTDDSLGFPKYKEYLNAAVALDNEQVVAVGYNAPESYFPPTASALRVTAEGTRSWFKAVPVAANASSAMTVIARADGTLAVGGMSSNCGFVTQLNKDNTFGSSVTVKYAKCASWPPNGVQTVTALIDRKVGNAYKLTAVLQRDEYGIKTVVADVAPDGAVTASYAYPPADNVTYDPRAAVLLADGRIVIAGRSGEAGGAGGDDAALTWLNADLSGPVRKRYGTAAHEIFHALAVLPDGSLVAAGTRTTGTNPSLAIVARIAADGSQMWEKEFGGSGAYELRGVVTAPDSGLFFVGKRPEVNNTAKSDLWMMALDADGDPFWSSQYGAQGIDDAGHALVRHASGRLTAVGWRIGNLGLSDYLAVRVNDGGAVTCSDAGACAGKTAASCVDNNSCTASVCVGDSCTHKIQSIAREDGNACTVQETCTGSGVCQGGGPVYCDDGNPCTTETCDSTKGCVYSQVVDSTPCSPGKSCQAGVCQ